MLKFNDTTLFMDIETHSVDERWSIPPREYFRLGQWAWGEGPVQVTSNYDKFMPLMDRATTIVAQNGHSFDWSVLYGKESLKPVYLARENKLFDTFIHATLAYPAPFGGYTNSDGNFVKCVKPEQFKKWYRLDNLGHQLGVDGKLFELSDLAEQYEYDFVDQYSAKTGKLLKAKKKIRKDVCCGYGHIPVDHPDFLAYARQDVVALRNVARALLERMPFNEYAKRAQVIMALMAQVTRNGFRVDQPKMNERIKLQAEEAAWILDDLNDKYGLPLHKTLPLRTNEGKEALAKAFGELGIEPDAFEQTANGAVSWSGDSVKKAAGYVETDHGWKAPEITSERQEQVVKLADAVATLAGQRSLAELTRDSLYEDGMVHPDIMPLQRSGRMSTTKPGLTIWDDSHKDYYLPDSDDELLVEFDFSNADARAVAAESGDKKFAERFQPGQDGHMINAWLLWGKEKVGTDKNDPETAKYRQDAKAPGHGIGYNMGANKMSSTTGLPLEDCKRFIQNYQKEYRGVVAWQQRVVKAAQRAHFIVNSWGRRMPVEPGREFTQTPALLGQGDTNELLMDGLMRLPDRLLRKVKLTVHDALVMSLPKATIEEDIETVTRCFAVVWGPREGGQQIEFPMGHGKPGKNWKEAVH